MITVTIRGKEFPLCFTVAALDEVNKKCGGLKELSSFLNGNGDPATLWVNTGWMLGVLIREGEENRLISARFDGTDAKRRAVPDSDAIIHLMTVSGIRTYRTAVLEAINESMYQEIEAELSKNVENAELE